MGNLRSLRLVQQLSFRREGFSPRYVMVDDEWRDHKRWAVPKTGLAEAVM
jgi:ribosomal-protein-alanine N-acetyltransferase